MPALTQDNAAFEERLQAALWYAVGKTVDAVMLDTDINVSPQFIAALTYALHAKINTAATDMEAFAKHAGRSTVTSQDVLLLARNNEALQSILNDKTMELKHMSAST